jgi:hypothetical protein
MTTLTQDYIKTLFDYRDGALYWKVDNRANKTKGKRVGGVRVDKNRPNYKRWYTTINRKPYALSRLIFLWHLGWLPTIVDHEDRNPLNDKIENLRAADYSGNSKNRTSAKGSSSIYLGVHKDNRYGKWCASINVKIHPHKKRQISGGSYSLEEEAALAYNRMAVKYHGEFANLNIINSIQI